MEGHRHILKVICVLKCLLVLRGLLDLLSHFDCPFFHPDPHSSQVKDDNNLDSHPHPGHQPPPEKATDFCVEGLLVAEVVETAQKGDVHS